MNIQVIENVLVAVVILVWVGYRQTTWRPAVPASMWRGPAIMAVVGAFLLFQQHAVFGGLDAAVLTVELVISLGVGAWMGAIAHYRRIADADGGPQFATRTGWWGLALWVVVIVVRIGVGVIASGLGAHAATTTGVIVLLLAANRVARVVVIGARVERLRADAVATPRAVHGADA